MKEIDWSKAPEWAGAVISSVRGVEYFVSQWGGSSARRVIGLSCDDDTGANMTDPHEWSLVALRSPVWNGEGLPPVGTACEHRTGPGMNWSSATVLAYGEKKVFYRDSQGFEWTRPFDEIEFRPIRTPEQIAAEERETAIQQMCEDAGKPDMPLRAREQAGMLYDAGWRKQEQPK